MSVEHVREYLRQFDAQDRVMEFEVSSATVELAAQALNCEPGRIAKTLSFMAGDGFFLIKRSGCRYPCRHGQHQYRTFLPCGTQRTFWIPRGTMRKKERLRLARDIEESQNGVVQAQA